VTPIPLSTRVEDLTFESPRFSKGIRTRILRVFRLLNLHTLEDVVAYETQEGNPPKRLRWQPGWGASCDAALRPLIEPYRLSAPHKDRLLRIEEKVNAILAILEAKP